jgi:hypothetical protein
VSQYGLDEHAVAKPSWLTFPLLRGHEKALQDCRLASDRRHNGNRRKPCTLQDGDLDQLERRIAREDVTFVAALAAMLAVVPAWLVFRLLTGWML